MVVFRHPHTGQREATLQDNVAQFNADNDWNTTVNAAYQRHYGEIFNKSYL